MTKSPLWRRVGTKLRRLPRNQDKINILLAELYYERRRANQLERALQLAYEERKWFVSRREHEK